MLRYVYMPYWWLNSLLAGERKTHVSKEEIHSAFSFAETESFLFLFPFFPVPPLSLLLRTNAFAVVVLFLVRDCHTLIVDVVPEFSAI